jgi:hypothetical protein
MNNEKDQKEEKEDYEEDLPSCCREAGNKEEKKVDLMNESLPSCCKANEEGEKND